MHPSLKSVLLAQANACKCMQSAAASSFFFDLLSNATEPLKDNSVYSCPDLSLWLSFYICQCSFCPATPCLDDDSVVHCVE